MRQWVKRLEKEAEAYPKLYLLKVIAFLVVGFGYLVVILLLLIGLLFFSFLYFLEHPMFSTLVGFSCGGLLYLMAQSFQIKQEKPQGIRVTEGDVPELFKEIRAMQQQLNSSNIDHVLLVNEYNASVVQVPRFGVIGGHENYLVLGVPLMLSMSNDAFRAVIAHELGHLSKSHSRFAGWIYRTRVTWSHLIDQLEEREPWGTFLFRWFINWFVPRFQAYTFVYARHNEYEADRIARDLTTKDAISECLCRIKIYKGHMNQHFWDPLIQKTEVQAKPPAAFSEMKTYFRLPMNETLAESLIREALEEVTGLDDTHPSLSDRLRYLDVKPRLPEPVSMSAASIFLGTQEDTYLQMLDEEWQLRVADQWETDHDDIQEKREQLAKYRSRLPEELTPTQLYEYAQLIEAFIGEREALAWYEKLLEQDPNHVSASVATGVLTLRHGPTERAAMAIEWLRRAVERDHEYTLTCCQALIEHYQHKGDTERVEHFQELINRYLAQQEESDEERSGCWTDDSFVPHELPNHLFTRLLRMINDRVYVKSAFLMRKEVKYHVEKPMYVLFIDVKVPFLEKVKPFCRQFIDEMIDDRALPDGTLIVSLNMNPHLRKLTRMAASQPNGVLVAPVSFTQWFNPKMLYRKALTNLLNYAIKEENVEAVKQAIVLGADVHALWHSQAPMNMAANAGNIQIMELLVQAGTSVNVQNSDGVIPLYYAAYHHHLDVIDWLLKKSADPNIRFNSGQTVLFVVCVHGHSELLQTFLSAGANPNVVGIDNHESPMMFAVDNGHLECVKILINAGADLNLRTKDGNTALRIAEDNGYEEIALLLREHHALI